MGSFFSHSPVIKRTLEVIDTPSLSGVPARIGVEVLWLQSVILHLELMHEDVLVLRVDSVSDSAGYLSCLESMRPQLQADHYKIDEQSTLRLEVRAVVSLYPCMTDVSDDVLLATNGLKNQMYHLNVLDFTSGSAVPQVISDSVIWVSNVGKTINALTVKAFREKWDLVLPYQADLLTRSPAKEATELDECVL